MTKNLNKSSRFRGLFKINIQLVFNVLLTLINIALVFQTNNIAQATKKVSEANLGFEIDKRSQEYVDQAYSKIYDDVDNFSVIRDFKENKQSINSGKLLRVIDILESVGSDFCQGTAKARHIRIYFLNTLKYVCDNSQVLTDFAKHKNGVSILCAEFYPYSKFAKILIDNDIDTCEFIDSAVFQGTNNKKRFEFK